MENQVEEIKRKIDIVALISETVQLKKAGRNYKGLCPFHGEKTPSFMVNPERQIFKCFGCNEGGDALSFVEKYERVSFLEALQLLADRAGIKLKKTAPDPLQKQKETLFKINRLTTDFYHYVLLKHEKGKGALDYLKARGVSPTSIKNFELGVAPNLESATGDFLTKKGFSESELINSGVSLKSQRGRGIYDRFRGRLMFPIKDLQGRVIGFSGRLLGSGEPKYLNSPDSSVFSKSSSLFGIDQARSEISKKKQAVLVEGNLDVVSSFQAGVGNVVAPLGTALTSEQVSLLARFGDNLVLAFDTDSAGIAASKRAIEIAENQNLAVKVADLGSFKDPDELIKEDPKGWEKVVQEAVPIYDFVINKALKRFSGQGAEGKRKVIGEVKSYLKNLSDPILREHYLQFLADRLGIEVETVRSQIKIETDASALPNSSQEKRKADQLEEYLLALLFTSGSLKVELSEGWFEKAENKTIFGLFKEACEKGEKIKVKDFVKKTPAFLSNQIDEILLQDIESSIIENPEILEKEITTTAARLELRALKAILKKITLAIKQAEAAKKVERLAELTNKFRDLSTKLATLDRASNL